MRILRFLSIVAVMSAILSVSAFASEPVILAQPQNVYLPSSVELPVTATFSVLATGDNISYQWQAKSTGDWYNLVSVPATGNSLTVSQTTNQINGKTMYRCVISNSDGSVVSNVVTVSVAAYILGSLPQLLSWISEVGYSIFDWVGQSCTHIVSEPLLLFTVGFLAVGACIALVSRLLARS